MTERQTTTRDLGLAIRDFCEGILISHYYDDGVEHGNADMIESIDVSDPDNLVFHMVKGAVFTVRIVRTGSRPTPGDDDEFMGHPL